MILLVDNYDSFTYNLYQLLAQYDDVTVIRNDALKLDDIAVLKPSHVVISPGPGIPSEAGICKDVIQYCADHQIPLLGVCLGHQAIVETFGGAVTKSDQPIHGKETRVFHQRQGLYADMPLPFKAARYHSLYAPRQSIPDCLTIDAENGEGIVMGVRHETLPIYGVQYHPESILTPEGAKLIENFVNVKGTHA